MTQDGVPIDAVVIGRNEGARLLACLQSLAGQVRRLVYVDSGSGDGSVAAARALGAEVVVLDMTLPFTAARARNAGLAVLADDPPAFVQMVDGDCAVQAGWLAVAAQFLAAHPQAAFQLTDSIRLWKKKVWEHAAEIIANQKPDEFDDW